jgi:DNA-binding NtrC family response regulator
MEPRKQHILLIDNEEGICRMLEAVLADQGYNVTAHTSAPDAVAAFTVGQFDLVITDVKMPAMDGLEVLRRLKAKQATIPVIMITAYATVELSIQALRRGAYDMLTKPFEPEELLSRVRNALRQTELLAENQALKDELTARHHIIGESPKLRTLLETARKVAVRDIPVLITGESGTGKELIAHAIHAYSSRRDRKFVAINCGAIPENLLESELFGHRKGAFTGADREHKGLLETADGGTLFLDEVGNLPLNVQKSLLRFLQDQEFYRVGDTNPTRVDVRVVSATNTDLPAAVQTGTFREDLYYRLDVIQLHLPPLRERPTDIPLLVAHFIRQQNQKFSTQIKGFTPEAMEAVMSYPWAGNIRQLSNVIQAVMVIESGEHIELETLAQFIEIAVPRKTVDDDTTTVDELDYDSALARFEQDYLNRLLRKTGGVVEEIAHQAGMNVATIYRKMKKYGLR